MREIIISSEVLLLLPFLPLSVPQRPPSRLFFVVLVQQERVGLVRLAAVAVAILQTRRTAPTTSPVLAQVWGKHCLELEPPGGKWRRQNAIGLLECDSGQVYPIITAQAASAFCGLVSQMDG